ncbi:hypothetical protein E2C01_073932 [Portunus trituberculatus]|uniref:Uncharacterized protein n=1 Tax=Portunus trituberculatus TaxID=210409 RepID=A0A5B7IBW8_PORTR|nr:hypothetical protein [Portunus trituberculatus]
MPLLPFAFLLNFLPLDRILNRFALSPRLLSKATEMIIFVLNSVSHGILAPSLSRSSFFVQQWKPHLITYGDRQAEAVNKHFSIARHRPWLFWLLGVLLADDVVQGL